MRHTWTVQAFESNGKGTGIPTAGGCPNSRYWTTPAALESVICVLVSTQQCNERGMIPDSVHGVLLKMLYSKVSPNRRSLQHWTSGLIVWLKNSLTQTKLHVFMGLNSEKHTGLAVKVTSDHGIGSIETTIGSKTYSYRLLNCPG